jgi:hypothetical protein
MMRNGSKELRVLVGVASAATLVLILWLVPKLQLPPPDVAGAASDLEARISLIDLENRLRATLSQIVGGFVAIVGVFWGWRNIQLQRERQTSDLFSSTVGQLASDNVIVRLAAVHSLARVAQREPAYTRAVSEALTAFIRTQRNLTAAPPNTSIGYDGGTGLQDAAPDAPRPIVVLGPPPYIDPIGEDAQEALNLLGALGRQLSAGATINLSSLNLEGASFRNGCFRNADFTRSSLIRADFSGADLRRARIAGWVPEGKVGTNAAWADMRNTDLSEADLSLAYFQHADFEGARLQAAELDGTNMLHATGVTLEMLKQGRNWEHPATTAGLAA